MYVTEAKLRSNLYLTDLPPGSPLGRQANPPGGSVGGSSRPPCDGSRIHAYVPPFCERHRWGYETGGAFRVSAICYTLSVGFSTLQNPWRETGGAE